MRALVAGGELAAEGAAVALEEMAAQPRAGLRVLLRRLLHPRPLQEVAAAAERKKLGGAEPAHSWGLRDATTLSSTDHFSKGLLLAGSGRLRDLLETTTSS